MMRRRHFLCVLCVVNRFVPLKIYYVRHNKFYVLSCWAPKLRIEFSNSTRSLYADAQHGNLIISPSLIAFDILRCFVGHDAFVHYPCLPWASASLTPASVSMKRLACYLLLKPLRVFVIFMNELHLILYSKFVDLRCHHYPCLRSCLWFIFSSFPNYFISYLVEMGSDVAKQGTCEIGCEWLHLVPQLNACGPHPGNWYTTLYFC